MGRMHSYKDYNITMWVDYKDEEWEYISVVSGPMNSGEYTTVNVIGSTKLPTAEDAYDQAHAAAKRRIDGLLVRPEQWI